MNIPMEQKYCYEIFAENLFLLFIESFLLNRYEVLVFNPTISSIIPQKLFYKKKNNNYEEEVRKAVSLPLNMSCPQTSQNED